MAETPGVDAPWNILFILTDQQHLRTIGANGNDQIRTPHMDHLAEEGINFGNAHTACPICTPARTSIWTGLYPHAHGVVVNDIPFPEELPTIATELKKAGYLTGAVGRMHFPKLGPGHGFEDVWVITDGVLAEPTGAYRKYYDDHPELEKLGWTALNNDTEGRLAVGSEAVPFEHHWETFNADETIRFLNSYAAGPKDKPFFMVSGYQFPHSPHFAPPPYDTMYDPAQVELPDAGLAFEDRWPEYQRRWYERTWKDTPEEYMRRLLAMYWGQVSMMDDLLGRLRTALDETGLAENTLIVFTSDHGDFACEHGGFAKGCSLFDCVTRVPLIIKFPDGRHAGTRRDEVVSLTDLFPTLTDYAGGPTPEVLHGTSLRPMIEGTGERADEVFSCRLNPRAPRHMIRTRRFKYCFNCGDQHEFYDLEKDPGEFLNEIDNPDYANDVTRLSRRLTAWLLESARPMPHIQQENVREVNQKYATWYYEHPEDVVRYEP